MGKIKMPKFMKDTQKFVSKNAPAILTGIGIAGMVTTTVLAVKATPKAIDLLKEAEEEKGEKLTPVETVKAAGKCYIPAAVSGVAATACFIGSHSIHAKRNAALATVCQISATALNEFKEKTFEVVDEETAKTIREKVTKEKVEKNPPKEKEIATPVITEPIVYLCYDSGGNQYFRSNQDAIEKAINRLNSRMNNREYYVSLNDLYYELGIRGTDIGAIIGWNRYRDDLIEPIFESTTAPNGEPCKVLAYSKMPTYGFEDL